MPLKILSQQHFAVAGTWKFSRLVPTETLVKMATEWRKRDPKYHHLSVRGCDLNARCISFIYLIDRLEDHERVSAAMIEGIQRQFRHDFLGYDLASDVTIIY